MKVLAFVFAFLIAASFVSSIHLAVSPGNINFNKIGDCKSLKVYSKDYLGQISAEDDFDQDFILKYDKNFSLKGEKKVKICLNYSDRESYSGHVLFRTEGSSLEIGSKISINLTKNSIMLGSSASITGFSILEQFGNVQSLIFFEGIFVFFMLILLVFLLLKSRKRPRRQARFIK